MSGNGRVGNGRGNNRRRPFRRRDSDTREEFPRSGRSSERENDTLGRGDSVSRSYAGSSDRKSGSRGSENQGRWNGGVSRRDENTRGEKAAFVERPKWVPPKIRTEPLPVPECPWCGKSIRDISSALTDKDSGAPVHFDCVAAKIAGGEKLEKGEVVAYIGGGRFGVVCFGGFRDSQGRTAPSADALGQKPGQDTGWKSAVSAVRRTAGTNSPPEENYNFKIKKIIEWENKDKRAEWRSEISDYYSVT